MTVAETLRAWAADADEEMAAPLRELADQYDAEVRALEGHYLAPIADLMRERCKVNSAPESFSVLEGLGVVAGKLEGFQAAEVTRQKRRATAVAKLEAQRDKRRATLDQVVAGLIDLRKLDTPPDDDGFAQYEQHIADLRAAYGRDHKERD